MRSGGEEVVAEGERWPGTHEATRRAHRGSELAQHILALEVTLGEKDHDDGRLVCKRSVTVAVAAAVTVVETTAVTHYQDRAGQRGWGDVHLTDVLLESLDVVEVVDVEEDRRVWEQQAEPPLDDGHLNPRGKSAPHESV